MAEKEVQVLCYWNGGIKYGSKGVYYDGPIPKKIRVNRKIDFCQMLCLLIGVDIDTQRSKLKVFGRYPFLDGQSTIKFLLCPVVDDTSLETMLEIPRKFPSIYNVELYLEVNSDPAACSLPMANPGSFLKRQRTQQVERDNEDEPNSGLVCLTTNNGSAGKDLNVPSLGPLVNEGVGSSAANPRLLSSLWVDEYELRVGLCFKDRDELKKAVDWCSFRARRKCDLQETVKGEYKFECSRWRCNWLLCAEKREEHGLVEITKCSGPHTCCPIDPDILNFTLEFAAEEIECLIRVQPTLTVAELKGWLFDKFGYELETEEMKEAKEKAIRKIYGDWDQSFRLLPKLMAAFHSSNGLVVDWQYDCFPNPEFASFRGVFWAFSQSIEGFNHCQPVIVVDTKDFDNGKCPMTLMIASGFDANDCYFPLAVAVTKEVSVDSWRWFLTVIREKVTQREGICLISSPHPDILAVIDESGSMWKEPWAYHRFCLDSLSSKFHDVFQNSHLKSLVEQAGSTRQQDEFDSHMETIKKENPEARQWLDQMPPHQWALSHDGGRRYGLMEIGTENLFSYCESFWSLGLPVTAAALLLFDELRLYFQNCLSDSRGMLKRGDMYSELVLDEFEEFRTTSVTYVVMPLDNNAFQVTTPTQNDRWIVQLSECMCTCGDFQAYKFPCLHAQAVCEKLRINPLQYVDNFYSVELLCKTYAATFNPVPQVSAWPEASGVPTLLPPIIPPPTIVPGNSKQRPRKNKNNKNKSSTTPGTIQKNKS